MKYGADVIKMIAGAGVLSEEESVGAPQYSAEEMKAICDEAAMWGRKVAAHAHGTEAIKRAVAAGVASVEHGSLIDDEGIRMMKEKGTFLVADVYNDDWILAEFAKMGYPEKIIEKERSIGRLQRENFAKAVKAGVKVAYGTDAGVYPHGLNARQFRYMVAARPHADAGDPVRHVERGGAARLGQGRRARPGPLRGPRRRGRRSAQGRHAPREAVLRHEGRGRRGVAMSRNASLALLLALSARAFAAEPPPDAGTLFRGASVYTAWDETPRKAAILVKDGRVVSVGNEAAARAAAPGARVVDLDGAVLVPGLTDAHGHVRSLGALRRDDRLPRPLEGGDPPARARALGLGAEGDVDPGPLRGTRTAGRTPRSRRPPTSRRPSPKTPVVLGRVDGHAVWVNAAALKAAGVTKATADPPGGRIERLKDGSPRAFSSTTRWTSCGRRSRPPGPDEIRKDIVAGLEACAKAGLTGVGEASGSSLSDLAIYEGLARDGKLPVRVYATVGPQGLDAALARGPVSEGRLHAPRREALRGRRAGLAGSGAPRRLRRRARATAAST